MQPYFGESKINGINKSGKCHCISKCYALEFSENIKREENGKGLFSDESRIQYSYNLLIKHLEIKYVIFNIVRYFPRPSTLSTKFGPLISQIRICEINTETSIILFLILIIVRNFIPLKNTDCSCRLSASHPNIINNQLITIPMNTRVQMMRLFSLSQLFYKILQCS